MLKTQDPIRAAHAAAGRWTVRTLPTLLVVSLAAGVVLRLFGAATWDFSGDEPFTFVDSLHNPEKRGLFSLFYYATHLSLAVFGETLLGTRLPALLAGVAAVPVFYFLIRDTFGRTTAAFATIVLSFSHMHVEISQYARYHSTVFLFATLHFAYFLKFLRSASVRHLLAALAAGVVATLSHLPAVLSFVPTGLYCLIALRWDGVLPNPDARRPLIVTVAAMGLGGLLLTPLVVGVFETWSGNRSYGMESWAMVPLFAFNLFTVPVFVGIFIGLNCLYRRGALPEFTLAALGTVVALLVLGVLGAVTNMSPRYVLGVTPLFFACIGAFCAAVYERFKESDLVLALTPVVLLVCAALPSLASFYLQRNNISQAAAMRYVLAHAAPGDVIEGNVGSPFVDSRALVDMPWVAKPTDDTFAWRRYLRRHEANRMTVWFAYEVPRSGLAFGLRRWLNGNAELVYEQRAHRIDRRGRTLTVWRKRPSPPAQSAR